MDIQVGDLITYINSNDSLGMRYKSIMINSDRLIDYKNKLENKEIEIIKTERPKYEVIEEKKELLTEEEKEFLKSYIKFTNYIPNKICKDNSEHRILFYVDEYLRDKYEFFGTFKNLEDSKIYTLKELGLK